MTTASVAAYREAMAEFAQMRTLDIWYAHLGEDDIMRGRAGAGTGKAQAKERQARQEEPGQDPDPGQPAGPVKLAEVVDGRYRIVSQPPVVVPLRELGAD